MSFIPTLLRCLRQALRSPCSPHLPTSVRGIPWQISRFFATEVQHATSGDRALHFGIVGSGPAGFYTATQLLKRFGEHARVDIIDRLPTPFGLVRSGVAPDHPETKNVINQFTRVGQDPRVAFLGNVHVGSDIGLRELRQHYDAVVLAHGAESNRTLGIPGEDLRGVISAREFVWWFNGHPDGAQLPVDLSKVERVTIVGLGNVALDCARVLLKRPEDLAATDIAGHALETLRRSAVRRVDLVGRRGAVQAAFTTKELREVTKLPGVSLHIPPDALALTYADREEIKASRVKKRMFEILTAAAAKPAALDGDGGRELHLQFLRSPEQILPRAPSRGNVGGVRLQVNELQPRPDGSQRAVGTGRYEVLPADLVLTSIGYKSIALKGAAFDAARGVVLHREGRVLQQGSSNAPERGLYVVGWAKRGPTGIIGTNLIDAEETVNSIVEDAPDLAARSPHDRGGAASLVPTLQARGVQVVSFGDWQHIDSAEMTAGQAAGKPREKFVDVPAMLQHATYGPSEHPVTAHSQRPKVAKDAA